MNFGQMLFKKTTLLKSTISLVIVDAMQIYNWC